MARIDRRYRPAIAPFDFEWTFPALNWWPDLDGVFRDEPGRQVLRVEEFEQDATLVVRVEVPGMDPDQDFEIEITEGVLTIRAERRDVMEKSSGRNFHRKEIRYGPFARSLPLPAGTTESEIRASYKDGLLEIRLPLPEPETIETTRVPIDRS